MPEGDITGTHAVDIANPEGDNIGYIGGNLTDQGFDVNISHIDKGERGKGYYQDAIQQMADKYGSVKSDVDMAPAAEAAWQKVGAEKQADGSYVLKGGEVPSAIKEGQQPESNIPKYPGDEGVRPPAETGGGGGAEPSAPVQAQEAVAPPPVKAPRGRLTPAEQARARQAELATGKPPYKAPVAVNDSQPHVSTIANRFTKERAAAGEIGPVTPGQGYSTREMAERGLQMGPEQVNQHISDLMQNKGDPIEQAKAVRGEEARLSQRSRQLSAAAEGRPGSVEAKRAADEAFQHLTDFHNNAVAKVKERFHALGMSLQGELPVDLSTVNGLREKFLQDTGKAPPASAEPALRRTAERVASNGEDTAARQKLGQEIEKATRRSCRRRMKSETIFVRGWV